ncbi:hypothetical protein [Streptomyces lanatus]|uniref:Uncharacterized protein n=1 Tax=Streptomyces lanatus TaxID=66900 RepID=A0ABV1XSS7_9ACTN|nr:hypothetical protein [Streptomyces lanatus]GHH07050.1 hypothetical protein GCM10018780_40520 [Streptomyces lanatus]
MRATFCRVEAENGEGYEDPSEDCLFELISDLNDADNTFILVQPDEDDPPWFASVAVLEEGGFEIVRRDTTHREHTVHTTHDIGRIASDLTIWLAARTYPDGASDQLVRHPFRPAGDSSR